MTSQVTDSVIESFIFANTPAFLYRRLRADASVIQLARSQTASALVNDVKRTALASDSSVNDVARGYAALVALTLQEGSEWKELRSLPASMTLRWLTDILAIHELRSRPTTTILLQAPSALPDARLPQSASSTTLVLRPT